MRTGAGFSSNASPALQSPAATPSIQHSAWHSPVPYLFGGLAAMLGLIAFALLILACSYWRLSGYPEGGDGDSDNRGGDGKPDDSAAKPLPSFEKGFVVIMAGDQEPTFLATPICSRASSFGISGKDTEKDKSEGGEEEKDSGVNGHGGDPTQTETVDDQNPAQ